MVHDDMAYPCGIHDDVACPLRLNADVTWRVPSPPPSLQLYDVSENKLAGEIPSSICNLSSLTVLNLNKNGLGGTIPNCIGNLHGKLPQSFAKGCTMRGFRINNNQIEGSPRSLSHCKDLRLLNVGNNDLTDTFLKWLQSSDQLQVLILRSNRFYGQVDESDVVVSFTRLCVIDLSHNNFSGYLPTKFFENLHAIREGVKMEYMIDRTTDGTMSYVDGPIPSSFGELSELESLDLSSNKLHGKIPTELKNLGFLAVLNLSHNNLTRLIPQGKHFDTFTTESYLENLGLCGLPLSTSVGTEHGIYCIHNRETMVDH
ncbi:Signal transduction histidine kinase, hybrid-type, ethylene sensor isoform 1 [Hibiscus syriacus]|uniref:Signal transduction histidine kinase, hybrid-type, ethylene sensor isoform 1 n=1 Tax=Hibiscus syriacus TaxID=106335 RepID=A0A6A3CCA4_HIBSY|nr:Signal transduction histidine kinase, hybrid-type, ethylene sensor isoform 1 [Hibiscus syriacus]